jgi:NAD(P)-dependent dehydrogenase (short-subunit alcohol dehydrogenase family)
VPYWRLSAFAIVERRHSAEEAHMSHWTAADIPDQTGRTAIITGANSGLGFRTAEALARAGAATVLACRDAGRGEAALERLRTAVPEATGRVSLRSLDLADLDSVRAFAAATTEPVDLLINNAGIMALPTRRTTAQGFEAQFGTNHLGHFALTGLLLPKLLQRPGSRVVTLSSGVHKIGRLSQLDDLHSERKYGAWTTYGLSKLANVLFFTELDRRLRAAGAGTISVAAHPGFASTNLQIAGPQADGATVMSRVMALVTPVMAQSDAMGALPTLRAATAPDVEGGEFYGPGGLGEQRGYPKRVKYSSAGGNQAAARRLWDESERLTGVTMPLALAG